MRCWPALRAGQHRTVDMLGPVICVDLRADQDIADADVGLQAAGHPDEDNRAGREPDPGLLGDIRGRSVARSGFGEDDRTCDTAHRAHLEAGVLMNQPTRTPQMRAYGFVLKAQSSQHHDRTDRSELVLAQGTFLSKRPSHFIRPDHRVRIQL